MIDSLLDEFLSSKPTNSWLFYPDKKVYVRKGHHFHPALKQVLNCFDIASIEVTNPKNGIFTAWLNELTVKFANSTFDAIYVESVLNPEFDQYLLKRGWYKTPEKYSNNYFLMLREVI